MLIEHNFLASYHDVHSHGEGFSTTEASSMVPSARIYLSELLGSDSTPVFCSLCPLWWKDQGIGGHFGGGGSPPQVFPWKMSLRATLHGTLRISPRLRDARSSTGSVLR
jgi:hypothetical protein